MRTRIRPASGCNTSLQCQPAPTVPLPSEPASCAPEEFLGRASIHGCARGACFMHAQMSKRRRSRKKPNYVNEITFESHNFIKVGRFSVRFRHRGDIQGPVAAGMRHGIQPPWRKRTENLPTLRKLWLSNVISLTQWARLLLPRKNDSASCIKRSVWPTGMQSPARGAVAVPLACGLRPSSCHGSEQSGPDAPSREKQRVTPRSQPRCAC